MLNTRKKFSTRYKVEKWFYEDSKKDATKVARLILEAIICAVMLALLFIIPSLFH